MESEKQYFAGGDMVRLKGVENAPLMQFITMLWEQDSEGNTLFINGRRKPKGALVYAYNNAGEFEEHIIDTRSFYKVEVKAQYHLTEAKKILARDNNMLAVEMINNIINKIS